MKKNMFSLKTLSCFLSASALLLAACSETEEPPVVGEGVQFTYGMNGLTRATDTQFETNDQIGIFALQPSAGKDLKASGNYADNVCYTYNASTGLFKAVLNEITLPKDGQGLAYYATYPYSSTRSIAGTFKVQEDQTTHGAVTQSDFCTAYVPTTTDQKVTLDFWHRLSRIRVYIDGVPAGKAVTMTLKNRNLEASYDLNTTNVYTATGTSKGNIKMHAITANVDYEAIFPPQTFNLGTDLEIKIGGTIVPIITSRPADVFGSGREIDYKLYYINGEIYVDVVFDGDIYPWNKTDIPDDSEAKPNPIIKDDETNTTIPNFNYTVTEEAGWYTIRLDMTGVWDPFTNDWVKLYGTKHPNQNVWLSIDNNPKGFTISNTSEAAGAQQTKAVDLVFLVDNSGSMDEESDALANQVLSWSKKLDASNLDIRFGLVGYDGAITGGLNMNKIEELDKFLNNGSSGTSRTMHFESKTGDDWAAWRNKYFVDNNVEECGVAALRLADENFNFRNGANRAYVNFTDEANYSKGLDEFNVTYVMHQENWPSTKGTIHSVISSDSTWYYLTGVCNENPKYYQRPWNMSDYTGGTTKFVRSDFSGVTLDDLPITGALENSYIIRFSNVQNLFDGKEHEVHITVKSAGPGTDWILADRKYKIIFEK